MAKLKVLNLYFSGTGNTYFVAKFIHDQLSRSNDWHADLFSIEALSGSEVDQYDMIILGFPVYGCAAPDILNEYLNLIKLTSPKKGFIYCTKALYSGAAIRDLAKKLKNLGIITLGRHEITMPGSDGITMLKKTSPYSKKLITRDFCQTKGLREIVQKIQTIVNHYESAKEIKIPFNPLEFLMTGLFKLLLPIANQMKQKLHADDTCIRCGICRKICPQGNIEELHEKIHFKDQCLLCMRCINQCPKESIQLGRFTQGKTRWRGPNNAYYPEVLSKKT